MRLKKFMTLLFCSFIMITAISASGAAQNDGVIGISKIVAHPALDAVEQGIQDELKSLGHNFSYDLQNANGEITTAASIANKFKSQKVLLAVGIATPTAQALVNAIKDIPVVFTAVTDPVAAGLVRSLDKGEGNVTGVSDMTPVKQQLEFLTRVKNIKRLGHVYSSHEANAVALADLARKACKEMGIEFIETTVTNSAEVKQAVQTIIGRVDGLYISTDNTVVSALNAVTDVAMEHKVPVMSADPSSAETYDVLAAWGFDYYKMGRATGRMISSIIKGRKPADIPILFMTDPSDVDLLINKDVADKLGLSFPEDVEKLADKVIYHGKMTTK